MPRPYNGISMVGVGDNLWLAVDAVRAHKLRAVLTVLGLTMGVATLITVMTLVQGANLYVEQKIANLGTNVFRVAKTPFAVVDFTVVVKALKNKNIDISGLPRGGRTLQGVRRSGRIRQRHALGAVPEQTGGRHRHHRLHAQHGGYRHAHARSRPLLHARRRPACGVRVHHRRLAGGSVLSRRESDRPQHSHRQPGIHGHRHVSEAGFRAGPGSGQLRSYSA